MPSTAQPNLGFLKQSIEKFVARGAKRVGSEYTLSVEGYPALTDLRVTAQIPQMSRIRIEHTGPYGVTSREQGVPDIGHEVTCSFQEVIDAEVMKALQQWYRKKEYLRVTLKLRGENDSEGDGDGKRFTLIRAFPATDPTDLSNEDNAVGLKISVTLIYAYCEEFFQDA